MKHTVHYWSVACAVFVAVVAFLAFGPRPPAAGAGEVYSSVTFVGDVHTSSWSAVEGITYAVTNGGTYTNVATVTNYYRLSGTNIGGRIPLSTNIIVAITQSPTTNAIRLSWTRKGGIDRHVIEKSHDLGVTWTNWLSVSPSTNSWLDTGTNVWAATIFTNVYTALPAPAYDFATDVEVSTHTGLVGTAAHGLGSASTNDTTDFLASTWGNSSFDWVDEYQVEFGNSSDEAFLRFSVSNDVPAIGLFPTVAGGWWLRGAGAGATTFYITNSSGSYVYIFGDGGNVSFTPQTSTNDAPTLFTPRYLGDRLMIHTTTQRIYNAFGTTTNDWISQ